MFTNYTIWLLFNYAETYIFVIFSVERKRKIKRDEVKQKKWKLRGQLTMRKREKSVSFI